MKNGLLVLLATLIVGCAGSMTLEDMEEAQKLAATAEEKAKWGEKIDAFYARWDKANLYFENKAACGQSLNHRFVCSGGQEPSYNKDAGNLTKEQRIRVWKREYMNCSCMTNADADQFLRSIQRQMNMSGTPF